MCLLHVILAKYLCPFHSLFVFFSFFLLSLLVYPFSFFPPCFTTMTKTTRKTYSMQHTVPRLPIPSLEESCALYLQSLRPLLSHEEYTKSAKLVHDFVNSDLGKSLQQRLVDIDHASPYNWLEDNFWLRKGKRYKTIFIACS